MVTEITNRAGLEAIASGLSGDYILMDDIDLGGSATPWTPIGIETAPFVGTLDGNGHIISNVYCHDSVASGYAGGYVIGLFACTSTGATISNLGLSGVDFVNVRTGNSYSWHGGLVALVRGNLNVSNCYVTGNINGGSMAYGQSVGGLIGNVDTGTCSVNSCWSNVTISGTSTTRFTSGGGVVGYVVEAKNVVLTDCYTLGTISVVGTTLYSGITPKAGGIIGSSGESTTTITDCVALQTAISSSHDVNRIAAYAITSVTNVYAYDDTTLVGTVTGISGTDVSAANYATKTWWETYPGWSFDDSSAWYWDSVTSLPKLRVFSVPITKTLLHAKLLSWFNRHWVKLSIHEQVMR